MLEGTAFTQITRWFGQRMEVKLHKLYRRFDKESNKSLLDELHQKVDALDTAYATKTNVTEAAADVGICAMAIAFNLERGLGESADASKVPLIATPKPNAGEPIKPEKEAPNAADDLDALLGLDDVDEKGKDVKLPKRKAKQGRRKIK